jgi:hypothetical protein
MANPFSVAGVATWPNGPGAGTDNLTALPNNTAYGLGSVGTTTTQYYDDNVAPIKIKSGASGVSASGTASLYLVVSEDNTIFTNGVSPSAQSDQSAAIVLGPPLQQIQVTANGTTYYFREFSLAGVLFYMPSFWAVVIYNQSGAAFDGTAANFSAKHSLISYA